MQLLLEGSEKRGRVSWNSAHSLLTPSPRLRGVQTRAGQSGHMELAESWDVLPHTGKAVALRPVPLTGTSSRFSWEASRPGELSDFQGELRALRRDQGLSSYHIHPGSIPSHRDREREGAGGEDTGDD